MPHTRSARKNLRKGSKRRLHNRATLREVKEQIKKFEAAVQGGSLDAAQKEFNIAAKKLDKAASRRVVHPNLAARKKGQLARALHRKKSPAKPAAAK
jgi:small subunit ribosomal protein S20